MGGSVGLTQLSLIDEERNVETLYIGVQPKK